nr:protein CTR9 homolog [Tanacetum cinerariifolium]
MVKEENNLIETPILNDYDDSIDEVDPNIIVKEVVKDINKLSVEYTEDNSNNEDNKDSHLAKEEQNTEDSDSIKTPTVIKRGRPKKIVRDNENKTKGKKHKKNNKIYDENKKDIKIRTRTTPTALFNAMAILNVDRQKCLYEMGFGSLIGMAIHKLPGMLESLESRSPDDPFIKEWFSQFGDKNEVRPNDITDFPEYVDAYLRLAAIAKARNNVPLSIELIRDALEVDDKNPDALCMLGDLELKNDDWVKAKDTFRAAKDASNGKDSYATLCLGNWNYFAAVRSEKRAPKLEATHLEKSKELYTKVLVEHPANIIMPPKIRSQTNPQPTLTQEAVDQLVRDGIEAAIRAERERVRMEATRAGGPAGGPAAAPMARECSFTEFIKCGPTQFHGTEGAVGLVHWFEKMENSFEISECVEGKKVKFATATLHGRALTWWNSQVATLGRDVANGRPWTEVKQMMTDEFYPTEEVQRLEDELRHLKLRDMNIAAYTERFNELGLLCPDVVPNEKKKVELCIKGLPEIIKGETTSSRPATLNKAVRMAHALMEQNI